jgi:hypothetical protein
LVCACAGAYYEHIRSINENLRTLRRNSSLQLLIASQFNG